MARTLVMEDGSRWVEEHTVAELQAKLAAIRGAWDRAAEEGATVDLTPGMQCLIDLIKGGPR